VNRGTPNDLHGAKLPSPRKEIPAFTLASITHKLIQTRHGYIANPAEHASMVKFKVGAIMDIR
jgi:hypothetical protein